MMHRIGEYVIEFVSQYAADCPPVGLLAFPCRRTFANRIEGSGECRRNRYR